MILVQISDTHIDEPGRYVYQHYDTAASLQRAVEVINAMAPQPDLVLHTGDLACHGTATSYDYFRQLVGHLRAPLRAIPGNHDIREAFRNAFADTDWMPQTGVFLHYVIDDLPVRIICCDSVLVDEVGGEFCPERLAWLEARLAEASQQPTVVAMHHPPFASGMTGLSNQGLVRGGSALAALLRQHPQVQSLLAGHLHRPISATFANTVAFAGPTTSYPFGLDMGPERLLRMTGEPPAIAVHLWLDDAGPEGPGLLTHTVPIGDWDEPIVLRQGGQRMLSD